mgnify:CR=1 FL=1
MKLLTKSTVYFLAYSGILIMLGGVLLYFSTRKMVYDQIDNSLLTELEIIRDQIEQTKSIPDFSARPGHQLEVRLISGKVRPVQVINDTIITDTTGYEHPYRYILYRGNLDENTGFSVVISQTLREKIVLLEYIGVYIFFLFLSLFFISIFLNYLFSRRLWRPFYITVDQAEKFDIQSDRLPVLPQTNISEFERLNAVIGQMTKKMRDDYLNLKEYHENAAHEIQTPLAVIRSKLEILAQRKELRKESLNLILSINEAATRLYKINQGLLMISKIDNMYFQDETDISLAETIEKILLGYREIMNLRKIKVDFLAGDNAMVRMNGMLADTLVSNLISNAVRYNFDGGFIRCQVHKDKLIISNSGPPLKTDTAILFRRFQKAGDNPQSVGLGLSIVKKIVEAYSMKIVYTCVGKVHEITLLFASPAGI